MSVTVQLRSDTVRRDSQPLGRQMVRQGNNQSREDKAKLRIYGFTLREPAGSRSLDRLRPLPDENCRHTPSAEQPPSSTASPSLLP